MTAPGESIVDRFLDGVDLLIDCATLGEFGLEPTSVGTVGDEGAGCDTGREALAPTLRSNRDPLPAPELVWTAGNERLEGASLITALR
ncbi:MAG: hypothetical protein ACR2N5_05190 [Solirubrobacterales bacterium]